MIKFLDLHKINEQYRKEIDNSLKMVLDSGWYIQGSANERFEADLKDYIGAGHAICCGNGLDALRLIFKAYILMGKLVPGDEVLVPANTFIASVLAITDNELIPVFVEPDEDTYNISPKQLKKHIGPATKVLLNVHLYGQISYSEELKALLEQNKILHIEDNAQAIGASWNGKKSGSIGDASAFSFYPGKNLGAFGDAGAVCTDDDLLAEHVRSLGNYGSSQKYVHALPGLNSRMDEIQAAILQVKLPDLDRSNDIRRQIASRYRTEVKNDAIKLPECKFEEGHVWHLFVVRVEDQMDLQRYLKDKGIQSLIHYPIPPHKQRAYSEFGNMSFPLTERMAKEVLSLPISPVMTEEEVSLIINALNNYTS